MFKCGFFNSINGDRKYNAEEMNNPYFKIISNGVFADDKHSNDLQVESVNGLIVKVNSGKGMFFNKWAINDSDLIFTIPTPPILNTRIDSLIVSVDISESERKGVIEYRKGDNLETPYPPELINTEYRREYRLANITVRENVKEITQADIEDTRPTKECGFITNLLQDSDITATYKQWEKQFELWFNDIKSNLINHTLLLSLTNTYVTETEAEKNIKINIPSFTSQLDILEVYINGLKLVNNIDYAVNGFEEIILTLPVDKGTQIEFVLYKSVDSSDVESIKDILIEINNNIQNLNNDIFALEEEVATNTESINTNLQSINANKDNIDLIKKTYANLVKSDSPTLNNLNTYIEAGSFFGRTITDFETLPEQFTGHDLQYAIIFVQRGTDFAKQNLSFIDFTDNKHFDLTRGLLFNGSGMIQGSTPWQSISIESETATFSEGANTDKLGNVIDETYAKKTDVSKIKVENAINADNDSDGNKINTTYSKATNLTNDKSNGVKTYGDLYAFNVKDVTSSIRQIHSLYNFSIGQWYEVIIPLEYNEASGRNTSVYGILSLFRPGVEMPQHNEWTNQVFVINGGSTFTNYASALQIGNSNRQCIDMYGFKLNEENKVPSFCFRTAIPFQGIAIEISWLGTGKLTVTKLTEAPTTVYSAVYSDLAINGKKVLIEEVKTMSTFNAGINKE